MMRIENKCYCCPVPATTADNAMDLDSALNELGMLSSITDSRRQYLQEKARRDSLEKSRSRNMSEPSLGSLVAATPSNSPIKQSSAASTVYHVLHLNPQYVVSLSSGCGMGAPSNNVNSALDVSQLLHLKHADTSEGASGSSYSANQLNTNHPDYPNTHSLSQTDVVNSPSAARSDVVRSISFGSKYSQENIDYQVRSSRTARLRLSRLKRFKKPYEVPWLQNKHRYNISYPAPMAGPSLQMPSTAAHAPRSEQTGGNSCSNTPEKPDCGTVCGTVARSRSLDELDFSKLRLAEAENHNFILEKKEIESVSQNLQKLHVYE